MKNLPTIVQKAGTKDRDPVTLSNSNCQFSARQHNEPTFTYFPNPRDLWLDSFDNFGDKLKCYEL
jgi:hypothetical protein